MQKAKAKSKAPLARVNKASKAKGKVRVPLHHHVKRILGMTPKFVHGMVVGAFVGVLLVSVLRSGSAAHALSMNVSRDCTANAVIHCGALSTAELVDRYSGSGVATMYAYFGISASEIKNIGTTAVAGTASKDGTIRVNSTGKVVATGSLSMGRENITGSTKIVKDGFTFYVRAPKVAFIPNSLPVYVSMVNGQFQFAIIPGCGNPLEATAVVQQSQGRLQPQRHSNPQNATCNNPYPRPHRLRHRLLPHRL